MSRKTSQPSAPLPLTNWDATGIPSPPDEIGNAYWVNFAKTGNPDGAGLPEWPAHSTHTEMLMGFSPTGPVAKPDPWKERLDLVERLAERKK